MLIGDEPNRRVPLSVRRPVQAVLCKVPREGGGSLRAGVYDFALPLVLYSTEPICDLLSVQKKCDVCMLSISK